MKAYISWGDAAVAVTMSDSVDDPNGPFAGLFVPASSTVKATLVTGDTVTFSAVSGFVGIPVARVWTTGTTVSSGVILGIISPEYRGSK